MKIGEMNRTEQDEAVEYVTAENIAAADESYKKNFRGQLLMLLNLQAEGRNETAELLEALIRIGVYFVPTINRKGRATLKMLPIVGAGHFKSIESWQQWRDVMLKSDVVKRDLAYIVDRAVNSRCHYDDCSLRKFSSEKDKKFKCDFKADCLFVNPTCDYAEQMFEQHYSRLKQSSIEKIIRKYRYTLAGSPKLSAK